MATGTYDHLVRLLEADGVRYVMHDYGERRVGDVQGEPPFPLEALVKTLVFQVNGFWVLVGLRAQDRLDYRKMAAALGVSRQSCTSAAPEEVERGLGMEPGAVAPFSLHDQTRILLDSRVPQLATVYCGAGTLGKTLSIAGEDLARLSRALVADLAR